MDGKGRTFGGVIVGVALQEVLQRAERATSI
jgi:hypothetical protein